MRPSNITLNRNLKAAWLCEALRLAAGDIDLDAAVSQLENTLRDDISGAESIRKSIRYLRQIWLVPSAELLPLRNEALEIYRERPTDECARTLSFFILMAKYPFMREVVEVCGRLLRLQGSIKTEQIKRRIMEIHGEREPVLRSARYAVSIMADLGVLSKGEKKGIYESGELAVYPDSRFAAFCLSALMASVPGKAHFRRSDISGHLALFAVDAHALLDSALTDPRFVISRESISEEMISQKQS